MGTNFILDISQINKNYKSNIDDIESFKEPYSKQTLTFAKRFLNDSGQVIFKADDLRKRYFDTSTHYDVFISHSSRDSEYIYGYAMYLKEEYGLEVFVDSMIWADYADIVDYIVDEYEADVNEMMANLHIILAGALSEAIESSRYFLFIKSKNSMHNKTSVLSPWVYYELKEASKRSKVPKFQSSSESFNESVHVQHNVESFLSNFETINKDKFEELFYLLEN